VSVFDHHLTLCDAWPKHPLFRFNLVPSVDALYFFTPFSPPPPPMQVCETLDGFFFSFENWFFRSSHPFSFYCKRIPSMFFCPGFAGTLGCLNFFPGKQAGANSLSAISSLRGGAVFFPVVCFLDSYFSYRGFFSFMMLGTRFFFLLPHTLGPKTIEG